MAEEVEAWHWRLALQVAAQMPDESADVTIVLDCLDQLLAVWHPRPPTAPNNGGADNQVLRFPGVSRMPRRRATSRGRPSGLSK